MSERTAVRSPVDGNTSTGLLKLIALVSMFCDHAGKMLLSGVPEMRVLGRLAFPLYCWCLVVGASHTRSMPKYALRMLLVGVISQPLYMIALNHTWQEPDIFLTLLAALLGLWGLKERRWLSQVWAPPLALALSVVLNCNYGWKGVLFVFLLWAVRDRRTGIAAVMLAYCLFWGSGSSAVTKFFFIPLDFAWMGTLRGLVTPWCRLQALAILALPLILWRCPWRVRLPKWAGYALYPAHLVLLWLLEQIF